MKRLDGRRMHGKRIISLESAPLIADIIFDVWTSDSSNSASIFIKQINKHEQGNRKQLFGLNFRPERSLAHPDEVSLAKAINARVAQCAIYIFLVFT